MRSQSGKILEELYFILNDLPVNATPIKAYTKPPPDSEKRFFWIQQPFEQQDDTKDRAYTRGTVVITIVDRTKSDFVSLVWIEQAQTAVLAALKPQVDSTITGVPQVFWAGFDIDSDMFDEKDGTVLIKNLRYEYMTGEAYA